MRTSDRSNALRGLVVSDLHLFARRSEGPACVNALRARLALADVLVLNGDTFDFRWSALPSHEATQAAALAWLRALLNDLPKCQIHFVLGNHDCLATFKEGLTGLAAGERRLKWHEYWLRLGPALFLHGDCANAAMDWRSLKRYREVWAQDRRRGRFTAAAYSCADRLGVTRLVHTWHFPRGAAVQRVAHHLDEACPGWRSEVRDCYFGHTHLPFSSYMHDGITFHNTGSAIRNMGFNPISFAAEPVDDQG
jgi:hypothetical protein